MQAQTSQPPWLQGIRGDFLPKLITSSARVIRVVAGPGSGKTTGLKCRVMRLLEGDAGLPKVSAGEIFVGTFTRAIAGELAAALGVSTASDDVGDQTAGIRISTLHALALQLLRQHPTARSGRILRFLMKFEKEAMLYDIGQSLSAFPTQMTREKELRRICAAWAEGTDLRMQGFAGEMERWLRRHGGMLIDEVVQLTRLALESGSIPADKFDHVIIDEYQDLTAAEQKLVEEIWSGNGSLVVLGDDDQSIYAFRNNHPGGITEFLDRWKNQLPVDDISIPDNGRCGKVIVDLANAMMAAAGSKKPPMNPQRSEDGELSLVYWPSVGHEIRGLAQYIRARSAERFLVLVPRRFIGYRLKEAIGSDARTSFHEEVLELPIVQQRFALACLVSNPTDRVSLRAVLGFHANSIEYGPGRNAAAYQSIAGASEEGVKLLEAIVKGVVRVHGEGCGHIRVQARNVLRLFEALGNNPSPEETVRMVFDPTLAEQVPEGEKRDKAKRDLQKLQDAALSLSGGLQHAELAKVLDQLRYRIATRIPLNEASGSRVRIMTLHGAKGLEAEIVIVAGVADQVIPGIAVMLPIFQAGANRV